MQTPAFAATETVRTSRLFRGLIWVAAADGGVFVSDAGVWTDKFDMERRDRELE